MPKILINEIDKTNPGAPGSYSNYAVLVAGFMGEGDGKSVLPDSNGVYEFSSAQDFKDTIGLVDPAYEYADAEHKLVVHHYGNKMAHELLKMGYPVVYLPIDPEAGVRVLEDESTWEIFKDKVNYDFRFVTHGLLKSYVSGDARALESRLDELEAAPQYLYDGLVDALEAGVLNELGINNAEDLIAKIAQVSADDLQVLEEAYSAIEVTPGITNPVTKVKYNTLLCAILGSNPTTDLSSHDKGALGIVAELKAKQALFDKRVNYAYEIHEVLDAANNPVPVEGELILDVDKKPQYDSNKNVFVKIQVRPGEYIEKYVAVKTITEDTGTISNVNTNIANLAKYVADSAIKIPGRGDCIALIELDENDYANAVVKPELSIIEAINKQRSIDASNGKYCAMTVPSVVYTGNLKLPGAFHYLACFMNSIRSGFAEWYAAAGYTRGVANYRIDHTTVTLGEIAINALEPRNTDGSATSPKFACNVIANFRGSYYLWGNRTAHPLGDSKGTDGELKASHFLNIRQLCTTVKKQLFTACRRFTFDPNSDTLWYNFINAIRPTLDAMKADQGIRDYKILKVTESDMPKATLKAKIRIVPIEAIEDFDLEVSLEDSFGETAAVVTE